MSRKLIGMGSKERAQRTILPLHFAVYHAVRDSRGGVPGIAHDHGINENTLQSKLNPNNPSTTINLKELSAIIDYTRDPRIAEAVAHMSGGVFVQVSAYPGDGSADVLAALANLTERFSILVQDTHGAWSDRTISLVEVQTLKADAVRIAAAAHALAHLAELEFEALQGAA